MTTLQAKRTIDVRPPQPKTPQWSITLAQGSADLKPHVDAWNDLAKNALEPNAFYESWMLLPAIDTFGVGKDLLFVLVYRNVAGKNGGESELCALFPLEKLRKYKGLPVSCLSLWEYGNCYLSTPLVRKNGAKECLNAFFQWLAEADESCPLMEWKQIACDGPVYQHLVDQFNANGALSYVDTAFTRALLPCSGDPDDYLKSAISSNKRRDLARKERRLREQGNLEFVSLTADDDVEQWIQSFLELEASGWKGRGGTALMCKEQDMPFFKMAARNAFELGRLMMIALHLDGRPIAIRCNYHSHPGSFFYKPAYDESLGRFSPGVLVEVENIKQMHDLPHIDWMDSCTSPDNTLLNSIWLDRRIIQTVVMATGKGMGRFVLSSLPLFRWLNRKLGRHRTTGEPA